MKKYKKTILIIVVILIILLLWVFDAFQYINIERIDDLSEFIQGFGLLGPIIFIVLYVLATIFFLPGVPLTLLAGIVFGPLVGTALVSISSTLGATASFVIGRYTGRDYIVKKFSKSNTFRKLDEGVKEEGWKMVAITRLVPIFPFNVQNYVYGLTDIPLRTYVLVSWICMLPGTIAYVFLSGAIVGGEGNAAKTFTYVGIGVGVLIVLSIVSKKIRKR